MCQKGVNADQMKLMISQAEDAIAMAQQWLEQIHHLADHGGMVQPSQDVAQASVLLGEARGKLQQANDSIEGVSAGPEASVELV